MTSLSKNVIILLVWKRNVVIIAKRIHLFPFRTQKLSSLAAMVLGGRPPGRIARSHVISWYGSIGRAADL